ncbi:hypothetical protein L3Q82_014076 [Scortum barcoo]|uniref:Uncharacterized protein n=1 Tax=Scortum barcoo TaxID=214431 RepID=A0ACB8VYU5_9TELE|nr:hypothetical protein L3Q82_014076 [Scortum barcoo]
MDSRILCSFYRCTIERILTGCITAWYSSCTALNRKRKALQRVVKAAQHITRTELPSMEDLYTQRCRKKATKIIKDPSHPSLQTVLPAAVWPTINLQLQASMEQSLYGCEKFQIALLPSVYGIEFIVALVGNLFALCLLVVRERRNWHTGVVLSCNLAISDLLYILTLPLLIIYYARGKDWVFGDAACKIERFLFTCNLYVSIFFIMAISVNRCVALAWPFFTRSHVQPAHAKAVSVIIWSAVGVISCPVLKFSSTCRDQHDFNKTLCVSFCHHVQKDEISHFAYKLFLAVFGCLVPFLVTFTSYCVVIRVVWKNVNITMLEKRKVALLVTSVLVLYAISFLPYHIFKNYYLYLKIQNTTTCWVYKMYQVTKGLATLNMCIHPLLYMAVFDSIRVACCGKSSEDNTGVVMRK